MVKSKRPAVWNLLSKEERQLYESGDRAVKLALTKEAKLRSASKAKDFAVQRKQQASELARKETLKKLGFSELLHEEQLKIKELLEKYGVDPIEGLLQDLQNPKLAVKEKIAIRKFLVPYVVSKKPDIKSVDIQQDLRMSVNVTVQSFRAASQDAMMPVNLVDEDDYNEFMLDTEDGK